MPKPLVIITVSHACIYSSLIDKGCDRNTISYARRIHRRIPGSVIVQSRTLRRICDNNRIICRSTPMRKRLRRIMKANTPNFIVIDVHSFPPTEELPKVTLLDTHKSEETLAIYSAIKTSNIDKVAIMKGSHLNDIQKEAREWGGQAIILEIRDNIPANIINRIAAAIESFRS